MSDAWVRHHERGKEQIENFFTNCLSEHGAPTVCICGLLCGQYRTSKRNIQLPATINNLGPFSKTQCHPCGGQGPFLPWGEVPVTEDGEGDGGHLESGCVWNVAGEWPGCHRTLLVSAWPLTAPRVVGLHWKHSGSLGCLRLNLECCPSCHQRTGERTDIC